MEKLIIFCSIIITLFGCQQPTGKTKFSLSNVPEKSKVGVKVLPKEIAQVEAPFPISKFTKPVFPTDTITLKLIKDSINTGIIQKAINSLSKKGGGIVVVPKGKWFSGRIELKDNINLYFQDGAILSFSGELEDYLPVVPTRIEGVEVMSLGACIYANNADNIAITGKGRLIGLADGSLTEKIYHVNINIEEAINAETPVHERIVDGIRTPWVFPPMFISPINCTKVYIEGISLEKTVFWNIVPIYCNNVIIRGVTVNSVGIPRGDGMDIESSKNVLIEYCNLSCGDDCFTLKSGRGADGIRVNKPTENVIVRFCLAEKGLGGITCGSETAGIIRNLYVHDCVFIDTGVGIRFKTRRPRGGGGENLFYERIRINIQGDALKWDMLGSQKWVGELANRLPAREVNKLTPHYKNIHIENIIVEKASHFVKVIGIPESPLDNVTIENAEVNCNSLIFAHDFRNSNFKNININTEDSLLTFIDSKNIHLSNVNFNTSVNLNIAGEFSDSIFVKSSLNIKDTIYALSKK